MQSYYLVVENDLSWHAALKVPFHTLLVIRNPSISVLSGILYTDGLVRFDRRPSQNYTIAVSCVKTATLSMAIIYFWNHLSNRHLAGSSWCLRSRGLSWRLEMTHYHHQQICPTLLHFKWSIVICTCQLMFLSCLQPHSITVHTSRCPPLPLSY